MKVEMELWHLILLLLAFFGAIGTFGKTLMSLFEKRLNEKFKAQDSAREVGARELREAIERYTAEGRATAHQLGQLERDFLKWQAELPMQYVRREDYIRGQTILEAKMDKLYTKLELVQLKGGAQ